MQRAGAITVLAGLASGALFLSLLFGAHGTPLAGYFVELPLLFCGLALGLGPAALASAGAAVLALALGGLVAAAGFIIIEAAPTLLIVRQTLLWRRRDDAVEWYPIGRVLLELVLLATLVVGGALIYLSLGPGGIHGAFERFASALAGQVGSSAAAKEFHALALHWAKWIPGIVAASWVVMTILNAVLAQLLAVRAGMQRRPTPDLVSLEVPHLCAPVLALATLALALVDGWYDYLSATLVLLFALPFLFQGLAVVHAVSRRHAPNRLPLAVFYVLLVVFSWPLALGVVLLGLIEERAGLRRRLA